MEHKVIKTKSFEKVAQQYKEIQVQLEQLEQEKEAIRKELLDIADNRNITGFGVTLTKIKPEPSVDWKAYKEHFRLTEEKLKPFLKEKSEYFKIIVKKEIII